MSRKIVPVFWKKIEKGKIIDDNEEFKQYLNDLKDGQYCIKVYEPTKQRTDRQRRLYWLYLNILEKEGMGEAEDLHEYFKRVHLQPIVIEVLGIEMTIPNSTNKLSTKEFGEYLEKIYLETGVPIPTLDRWDFN